MNPMNDGIVEGVVDWEEKAMLYEKNDMDRYQCNDVACERRKLIEVEENGVVCLCVLWNV
jgi:hypothetical protein